MQFIIVQPIILAQIHLASRHRLETNRHFVIGVKRFQQDIELLKRRLHVGMMFGYVMSLYLQQWRGCSIIRGKVKTSAK